MRERGIEKHLKKRVEEIGGICRKWESPGHNGVPDRICIFEHGVVVFVEVKTTTGGLSVLQKIEIGLLRKLGCEVYVPRSKEDVDRIIQTIEIRLIAMKK